VRNKIYDLAREFSKETHGSSNYGDDGLFVQGEKSTEFVPISYIKKKITKISNEESLQKVGFVYSSADFLDSPEFNDWYRTQFNKKLTLKAKRSIGVFHYPDEVSILKAINTVTDMYDILRDKHVINNGKNLPVQLGEWYGKCIFGLKQIKSSSQRGFDFFTNDNKRVEVMIHWKDKSSPKGVKLKKSLVDLSDHCIIIYLAKNFMIRDILFLDSSFIMRKYATKGHSIFLKDSMISSYFFSVADRHLDKVASKNFLMKFAAPNFAMKLDDRA